MKDNHINSIVTTGFMSALVFLGTYFTRIEIGFLGGHIMVHLGNVFCLMAAILFGKKCGGLSGAIGMSLFDIISGRFFVYAVFMFALKYIEGFVCGYIKERYSNNHISKFDRQKLNMIAVVSALLINVVFSPVISFALKFFVYDLDFYVALINTLGSVIGVVVTSILSGILVLILAKILEPIFSTHN